IRFVAETMTFTNRGSIVFTAPEPHDGGDGVEILVDTLDLQSAKAKPLLFVTNNWRFLTDSTQTPWLVEHSRHVSLSAAKPLISDPSYRDDAYLFARTLTLDS